jgi:hypothetical protein
VTAADAAVEYVEPDYLLQTFQSPPQSEPGFTNSGMWGLKADGAGANAVAAWDAGFNSCDDVVVGVIGEHVKHQCPRNMTMCSSVACFKPSITVMVIVVRKEGCLHMAGTCTSRCYQ